MTIVNPNALCDQECHCTNLQCDQIWRNFTTLQNFKRLWAIFWMAYLVFGKLL